MAQRGSHWVLTMLGGLLGLSTMGCQDPAYRSTYERRQKSIQGVADVMNQFESRRAESMQTAWNSFERREAQSPENLRKLSKDAESMNRFREEQWDVNWPLIDQWARDSWNGDPKNIEEAFKFMFY